MRFWLVLFFPFFIFSQETIVVGDVDCSGEVNSEDASLILQYVTSIIDELPCQENMSGLTPEQLQEMIDMMSSQINLEAPEGINLIGPMYTHSEYADSVAIDYVYGSECCNELYYFEAFLFCSKLEYEGHDDWRLPSLKELENWISANNNSNLPIPNYTMGSGGSCFLNMSKGGYSERASYVYINNDANLLYYHHNDNVDRHRCFCVR